MGFDDAEQPSTMDQVCQMLGLDPVQWSHKTECCGAGFTMSRADVVARLSGRILSAAKLAGTEAVIVACPMCQANLDMRQAEAAADAGEDFRLPVLYLTQVIGLALGLEPDVLGLKTHFVDTTAIVARLRGQAQAPAVAVGAAQEK
jgi:heterodisulfide reductase subunit B